ncbi:MAG: hypothetical protein LZF60_250138 [Nitrospira sp.]|nr:MAG: hypothetical protein LZF60_250138 [Nitrospira sp.]
MCPQPAALSVITKAESNWIYDAAETCRCARLVPVLQFRLIGIETGHPKERVRS